MELIAEFSHRLRADPHAGEAEALRHAQLEFWNGGLIRGSEPRSNWQKQGNRASISRSR
jgi:hypothetical protein